MDRFIDFYNLKIKELSPKNKDRYMIACDYLISKTNNDDIINDPEKVWDLLNTNPKWKSINTLLDKFKFIAAVIGTYDEDLHELYMIFRSSKEEELQKYSNNRKLKKNITAEDISSIDNEYFRFILRLYTNYPPLRSDYSTVLLSSYDKEKDNYYKDGIIYFNELVKNKKKRIFKIKLNSEDTEYIEKLLNNNKTRLYNESIPFKQYLRKYTEEYLGISYGINDFRRLYFTNAVRKAENMKFLDAHKYLQDVAKKGNTSVSVILEYYFSEN